MHLMHTNRCTELMKNTQQEIKLKNQRGCFLRLSLALSLFHLILYAFCGDVYTKFIVFAYDISTSKGIQNFSHLKRLRIFESRRYAQSLYLVTTAKQKAQTERKTKSNQRTQFSKREIKLNVLFGQFVCVCVRVYILWRRRETDMNKVLDFGIGFVAIALQATEHLWNIEMCIWLDIW